LISDPETGSEDAYLSFIKAKTKLYENDPNSYPYGVRFQPNIISCLMSNF